MKYGNTMMAILVVLTIMLCPYKGFSETVYVKGLMKITMRTGPSVDHKILEMITSGDELEVIESREDWSLVRTPGGKEGWVLSRFITRELPLVIVARQLKDENKELSDQLSALRESNTELAGTLKKANADLEETRNTLKRVESAYNRLKQEASEFLELKKKYEEVNSTFHQQQERIQALEKSLGKEDIWWFVMGAGVFLGGMIMGMTTRKKRKSSLL